MSELGCGGAQWAAAARAERPRPHDGLEPVRRAQLRHAQSHCAEQGATVPLVQASGEQLPFAATGRSTSFCDHGAMSFCDPEQTGSEMARCFGPAEPARSARRPVRVSHVGSVEGEQTRRLQMDLRRARAMAIRRRHDRLGPRAERVGAPVLRDTGSTSRTRRAVPTARHDDDLRRVRPGPSGRAAGRRNGSGRPACGEGYPTAWNESTSSSKNWFVPFTECASNTYTRLLHDDDARRGAGGRRADDRRVHRGPTLGAPPDSASRAGLTPRRCRTRTRAHRALHLTRRQRCGQARW